MANQIQKTDLLNYALSYRDLKALENINQKLSAVLSILRAETKNQSLDSYTKVKEELTDNEIFEAKQYLDFINFDVYYLLTKEVKRYLALHYELIKEYLEQYETEQFAEKLENAFIQTFYAYVISNHFIKDRKQKLKYLNKNRPLPPISKNYLKRLNLTSTPELENAVNKYYKRLRSLERSRKIKTTNQTKKKKLQT